MEWKTDEQSSPKWTEIMLGEQNSCLLFLSSSAITTKLSSSSSLTISSCNYITTLKEDISPKLLLLEHLCINYEIGTTWKIKAEIPLENNTSIVNDN